MSGVLTELRKRVSMSSADWSLHRSDAWIYGVIVGWDLKPDDDPKFDESAMPGIARRHHLTNEQVTELRRLHDEFEALLRREEAQTSEQSAPVEPSEEPSPPAAVFILTLSESPDPGRFIVSASDAGDSEFSALQIAAASTAQFMPWDFTVERMTWDDYVASGGPDNPNYEQIVPNRKQAQP